MGKIVIWIMANGATVLGLVQAIIKALKELLTGIVNLVSVFLPQTTTNTIVEAVRNILNVVDGWIEQIKGFLLPKK